MNASVISIGKNANRGGAILGTKNPALGTISQVLRDRLRMLFPKQTWTYVEKLLYPGQTRERLVKHRLAGTREFTVDELAALLRSEYGLSVLSDVMAGAEPAWWRRFTAQTKITNARHQVIKSKQELEEVIHATDELAATIARAETSICVQDEEFGRVQFDGYRAAARVPAGPVASARKA